VALTQVWKPEDGFKHKVWAKLVEEHNYKLSDPFMNAKSGNHVSYLTKDLGQTSKAEGFENDERMKEWLADGGEDFRA
jgi:hypothetical protein